MRFRHVPSILKARGGFCHSFPPFPAEGVMNGVGLFLVTVLNVAVCDQAGLDTQTWTIARNQAVRIFEHAGIKLIWSDGGPGRRKCGMFSPNDDFTVVVAATSPKWWTNSDAMGAAPEKTERAYVFYNAVQQFIGTYRRLEGKDAIAGIMLGYVIAHELGHLLIPENAHGFGIMSPNWRYEEWRKVVAGTFWFDPDHAKIMQGEIQCLKRPATSPERCSE
jgi:hypothetical protein